MLDRSAILRYLKVKALADQGEPGERTNAARILQRMDEEHPGIAAIAEHYQKSRLSGQQRPTSPPPGQPPPGVWPKDGNWTKGVDSWRRGNWEELFNFAREVASGAYDFAYTMANAHVGQVLAEAVTSRLSRTRAGNIQISLRMPPHVRTEARGLNVVQQEAFRSALHELVDVEIDKLLGIVRDTAEPDDYPSYPY